MWAIRGSADFEKGYHGFKGGGVYSILYHGGITESHTDGSGQRCTRDKEGI